MLSLFLAGLCGEAQGRADRDIAYGGADDGMIRARLGEGQECLCNGGAPATDTGCAPCRAGMRLVASSCQGETYLCSKHVQFGEWKYTYCLELMESYRDYRGDFKFSVDGSTAAFALGRVASFQNLQLDIGVRAGTREQTMAGFVLVQGCCGFIFNEFLANVSVLGPKSFLGLAEFSNSMVVQNATVNVSFGAFCHDAQTTAAVLVSRAIGAVKLAGTFWVVERFPSPKLIGHAQDTQITLINTAMDFDIVGTSENYQLGGSASRYRNNGDAQALP